MLKSESVLVNETLKLLWDFEIQTDHLILVRTLNIVIISKKKKKKKERKKERELAESWTLLSRLTTE